MKNLSYLFIAIFWYIVFWFYSVFAAIDLNVTPIKYEITTYTWATVTRPATLVNNGTDTFTIYTWKSDFVADGTGWTPRFVRYSELVHPDQQLSSWITIDTPSFVIGPGESKTVNFTINVPTDATPGWHYGAVFFKNNASEVSTSGNVWINVDYGILVLVDVDWDIDTGWEMWDPTISIGWWTAKKQPRNNPTGSWSENTWSWSVISGPETPIDNCPLWDFTSSNIDGKCIDNPFDNEDEDSEEPWEENNSEANNEEEEEEFEVTVEIPFENTWNTHIKPEWSVKLIDEDGNEIKQIWREAIINDNGAVIWEKIVDYIPINDNGWNVLPDTTRIFTWKWKGFPYKEYDEKWELVIRYWDPGEYYTKENIEEKQFLQLWERVCEKRSNKKITALIDFSYLDHNGERIEFNSAKEFEIEYIEQYIGINPYIVLPFIFIIILFIGWLWFILIGKKERRCKKCDTKVRKNWKICPKCKKKLKK